MARFSQANRQIEIFTPLGKDALLLRGFSGREAISTLFEYELTMDSEYRSLQFNSIIGKTATIKLKLGGEDEGAHYINGFISRFAQGTASRTLTSYHATLVPWLWMLTRTSDCRIFQNQNVPDIISKIFNDLGFSGEYDKGRLQGTYSPREYCVQYRETDFNFVSRLMEEEGIFYFFEHSEKKHKLILADTPSAHKPLPARPALSYHEPGEEHELVQIVNNWHVTQEVRPGKYTIHDFDPIKPITNLMESVSGVESPGGGMTGGSPSSDVRGFEIYDYPGEYKERAEGARLAGLRIQEEGTPIITSSGASDVRGLYAGFRFGLRDHYRSSFNTDYVIVSLQQSADQGGDYESAARDAAQAFTYSNTFRCIPHSTPFRPPRLTPVPVVHGSQTAIVTGPAGEEIYTDEYGRVKVQFHWDREGKYDDKSSCWVRVSQNWAGKRWGAIFLPRTGQEVIVDFLEGDPDRPIITGRVYNGGSAPPYKLPDYKTMSTIKSNSSKGGGGFNEIRFEDKKGDEQIFIHAQKNKHVRVKASLFETVGGSAHHIVGGDEREKVDGDKEDKVGGNHLEEVADTASLRAGRDIVQSAGDYFAAYAGKRIEFATNTVVINGSVGVHLVSGASFINITPGGIEIVGPIVKINSGGSASSPFNLPITMPQDPEAATTAEPGAMLELPPPKTPPSPQMYSPGALVLNNAAQNGDPFCEICSLPPSAT